MKKFLALDWEEYFEDNRLLKDAIKIPTDPKDPVKLEVMGLTVKKWNSEIPQHGLSDTAYRTAVSSPVLVDETGTLHAMFWGDFEGDKKMADWLRKNHVRKSALDDLDAHYENIDNQLVEWLRYRNWRPMIRKMWIDWLRLGSYTFLKTPRLYELNR